MSTKDDLAIKTERMELPLHDLSIVKAVALL